MQGAEGGCKPAGEDMEREKGIRKPRLPGRKIIVFGLLAVFAAGILLGGIHLGSGKMEYLIGKGYYQALADQVTDDTGNVLNAVDFEVLSAVNPNTAAWIYAEGGALNYPVVRGNDNDYYLSHLFDGTQNQTGAVFVDYRNAAGFEDRNTFIYGHSMANGTMFASLTQYNEEGYYDLHPEIGLMTPEMSYTLQVFAGYAITGETDIVQWKFESDEEFGRYLDKLRLLSAFDTGVTVTEQDRLVTLCVCGEDSRDLHYVLHCKIVN